jgi:hypothetical protein
MFRCITASLLLTVDIAIAGCSPAATFSGVLTQTTVSHPGNSANGFTVDR